MLAPETLSVTGEPLHTGFALAEMVNDGTGFTVTATVCDPPQPARLVLLTVYTVLTAGVTVRGLFVKEPGLQV